MRNGLYLNSVEVLCIRHEGHEGAVDAQQLLQRSRVLEINTGRAKSAFQCRLVVCFRRRFRSITARRHTQRKFAHNVQPDLGKNLQGLGRWKLYLRHAILLVRTISPLQVARNGFVCPCAEKSSWTVELNFFPCAILPGTALNRQLDLERVRVKTENMQHAVDHTLQKEQPTSDGPGEVAEGSDVLPGSVGGLLLQSDQVLVWRVVFSARVRPKERSS